MVAAGSIVMHDVPPRTIVRGNPAVVVKQLKPAEEPLIKWEGICSERGRGPRWILSCSPQWGCAFESALPRPLLSATNAPPI